MDWLQGVGTSFVGGLLLALILKIAGRTPKSGLKRIQQVWRKHRATIIASVVAVGDLLVEFWRKHRATIIASTVCSLAASAVVAIGMALWLLGSDTPPPPPPTEQQEQALEAPTTPSLPPTGKREALARALFGGENGLEQGVRLSYNDHSYGAEDPDPENPRCGYEGGHAGWHVRAEQATGGQPNDNLVFHSLTAGTVARVNGSGTYNEISVYRKPEGDAPRHMIICAHAREVRVTKGASVEVGQALGVQGQAGLTGVDQVVHVHIEVRKDDPDGRPRPSLACGKTPADGVPGPINPTEYLYRAWIDDREQ